MNDALADTLLIAPDPMVPPEDLRNEFLFGDRWSLLFSWPGLKNAY